MRREVATSLLDVQQSANAVTLVSGIEELNKFRWDRTEPLSEPLRSEGERKGTIAYDRGLPEPLYVAGLVMRVRSSRCMFLNREKWNQDYILKSGNLTTKLPWVIPCV
jgi:hypothetical protein